MPETQPEQQVRQTAYKVPISALLTNEFIQQEGWNPNYIQVKDKPVSRVNIIAIVIEKQTSESLITLTLDDSTSTIQARAFSENIRKATDINIGDPVLVIARPRKYNEQLFLTIEIIQKINPLWTKIRRLELQKEFDLSQNASSQIIEQTSNPSLNQSGDKILDLIKELDTGDGADINQIVLKSGLTESQAYSLLEELIKLGEIYEPRPSRIKILG